MTNSERCKQWRLNNPEASKSSHNKSAVKYYRKRVVLLAQMKNKPCADCGGKFPTMCMDFDHVRGRKEFAISSRWGTSLGRLNKEIAKCDLVCANCHRIRTSERKQNGPRGAGFSDRNGAFQES
jgi:hypothetical protein